MNTLYMKIKYIHRNHWGFQEQGPEGNQGKGCNKKLRKIT